jgi:hypothetical protein
MPIPFLQLENRDTRPILIGTRSATVIPVELKELIDQALADDGAGENAVSNIAFVAHINDPNPHPNYDDGASFLLAYENAKV